MFALRLQCVCVAFAMRLCWICVHTMDLSCICVLCTGAMFDAATQQQHLLKLTSKTNCSQGPKVQNKTCQWHLDGALTVT